MALLRKRLVISDDLPPELEAGDRYEAALVDAVKHFQLRHRLEANGSIDPQTLRALNEGEDDRRPEPSDTYRSLNQAPTVRSSSR